MVAPVKASGAAPTVTATTTVARKPGLPVCKANEALVTYAMSPLVPECAPKCAADADCKVGTCMQLSTIGPDGMPAQQNAKVCMDAAKH